MNKELYPIVENFEIEGEVESIKALGNGLINDTYLVNTKGDYVNYVLQRINNAIFTDVELLQNNIEIVTTHIKNKLIAQGIKDIERRVLHFIKLKNQDKTYYFDGTKYWRLSIFIDKAKTVETVNPEYSYYAGKAFGEFESMLSDIKVELGETIPNFHNLEFRLQQLDEAIQKNLANRLQDKEVQEILTDIKTHANTMCLAEQLHREGKLAKRICHCDTKVNNMLFDEDGKILCVIDLDTVMPSYIFSDYGDFLRTAANTVAEDSKELDKLDFKLDIFEAFTKGYLEGTKDFLTQIEKENLPYAATLFPFMQAVRFFCDYLNGDTYYKIQYPEHNLVRTRNQMKLFKNVLSKKEDMIKIINKY